MNHTHTLRRLTGLTSVLGLAVLSTGAFAQFTQGNIVVSRIGDGVTTLSGVGSLVSLVEYTPAGTLGFILPMPIAAVGSNHRLVDSGTATSDSRIKLSQDGRFITVPGFDADLLTPAITSTASATVNRVIGLVSLSGTIDTTTALNDAYNANNFRSVVTIDGSSFYTAGTSSTTTTATAGIRYTTLGSTTSTQIAAAPNNTRVVDFYGGRLYFGTGATGFYGLNTFDTAIPTASGATAANLFTATSGTGNPSQYDFFFASPTVVYIADDRANTGGGGIQKWTFDTTVTPNAWKLRYIIKGVSTFGASSLTGTVNPNGTVSLYAVSGTAANNTLGSVTDNLADVADPGLALTSIATAGANYVFRGVAAINPVISGTITLQAVPDPSATTVPVPPVSLTLKNGTTILTASAQLPANGRYYFNGFAGASYQVGAKGDRQLRKVVSTNTAAGSTTVNFTNLLTGDANGNNTVDVDDLTVLLTRYNTHIGDGSYDLSPLADLNYNGTIDVDDLTLLLNNYNTTGASLKPGKGRR